MNNWSNCSSQPNTDLRQNIGMADMTINNELEGNLINVN